MASQVVRAVRNLPASAGDERDADSVPGSGRFCEVGNGNLLQYSCLDNSMNNGAWQATPSYVVGTNDRVLIYCLSLPRRFSLL